MRRQKEKTKSLFLEELGKNVKKIRKIKKLTQIDLAMRINGDDNKISRIERGLYNFNVTSLLVLANALEVTLNELLDIKNIDFLIKTILEDVDYKVFKK